MSATPLESGIECVRWMRSMLERPGLGHLSPIGSTSSGTSRSLCSSSLERAIATVSWPP